MKIVLGIRYSPGRFRSGAHVVLHAATPCVRGKLFVPMIKVVVSLIYNVLIWVKSQRHASGVLKVPALHLNGQLVHGMR